MKPNDFQSDLDWTAFCYAASELSESETAAFESLLAEDQAAREALARAVELSQAVASAETMQPVVITRSRSFIWSRRLTWMAVGSAASLLVAVLWSGSGVGSRLQTRFSGQPESSTATHELAAAWVGQQQEQSIASDAGQWYPAPISESDASSEAEASADLADLPETPAWMTAAVASLAGQPIPGDAVPFDSERAEN